jgi:hypothetical protein
MGANFTINSATTDVVTTVKAQTNGDGVGALIEVFISTIYPFCYQHFLIYVCSARVLPSLMLSSDHYG